MSINKLLGYDETKGRFEKIQNSTAGAGPEEHGQKGSGQRGMTERARASRPWTAKPSRHHALGRNFCRVCGICLFAASVDIRTQIRSQAALGAQKGITM
jgi:hypothetical protein